MIDKKAILIILDGWGNGPKPEASAIAQAKTPFVDSLYQKYPNSALITFGEDVGLPEGQMGNSEVGHMNIGAGRVVYQELARINKSIRDRDLHQNPALIKTLKYAKANNKKVHLLGLISDGGVHSHINHLKALCDITQEQGLDKVFIHGFTDGRDTAPQGGKGFIKELLDHIENQSVELATLVGRYYAMDRDKRWERVKLAYDVLVHGEGIHTQNVLSAIEENYKEGITDEFLKPIVITDDNDLPKAKIESGDVVLFFNFRTDRPRELTQVLSQEDMIAFNMKKLDLYFATMTRYDEQFKNMEVLFTKDDITLPLGEVLANAGKTQTRIAETEKYPHVTFFFSGGNENVLEGENRIMIPSPKVATYDLKPEMSAYELTAAILEDIQQNQPDFICLNYANTDMVGHTGVFAAGIKAAEVVDECLQKLIPVCLKHNYDALIIADHGNADYMINEDGSPNTAHSMNLVPCILVSNEIGNRKVRDGRLADIAPTILAIMKMDQPELMTGQSLIE
ncbi:MAG: 2,3-bisphosphoglycerate-independent phosphoglycerate mutase [Saprospiraceae bacterium]|jgi:2,3-bisphosphoglycerate-independent phosphoglycerate mutase